MSDALVREAYGARADEYTELLGSVHQMHEADQGRIADWADGLGAGPVLDAGCGPGHWTAFLHARGLDIEGLDLTPEFVAQAQRRFPGVRFRVGTVADSGLADRSRAGVLAWYSLIHTHPDVLPERLRELHRILAPGGGLLAGFFDGLAAEPFPHAITTAYFWSVDALSQLLDEADFDVVGVEQRQDLGRRAHLAISAVARH